MNDKVPMKKTITGLILLLSLPFCASSQSDYSYIQPGQKMVFLNEPFDNNNAGWAVSKSGKFSDGRLNLKKGSVRRFVDIDFSKSFEIEMMIASNYPQVYLLIKLGSYVIDISPKFRSKLSSKMVNACKIRQEGDLQNNYSGTDIDFINLKGGVFNKYTIRKIDNLYYIYINEQPVVTYYFPPFREIGVETDYSSLEVDSYTISYLDTEEKMAAKEMPVRLSADAGGMPGQRPAGTYHALIIGVSDYADDRLDLEKPVKDAQQLNQILQKYFTFSDSNVTVLTNPTRKAIMVSLYDLRKRVGPLDNLLIFYAGHGYWDEEARQGYWWARDASAKEPSNWLSNSDVREQIRSIKSRHTLLISDACFSGGIFRSRGANSIHSASLDVQMLYKLPSRRAITSGTMTTVPDKSVFFEYLAKRLEANQDEFMTSQQLFDSFRQAVISNSLTVPQDGVIAEAGDEGGDFIFVRKKP